MTAMGAFVLFVGMLFWTKLRLVSEIPRSAYAVPKENATPDPSPSVSPPVPEGGGHAPGVADPGEDEEKPADDADAPIDGHG